MYTIKMLKAGLNFVKANPDGKLRVQTLWGPEIITSFEWRNWFRKCLREKINRNELKRGRKDDSLWFFEQKRLAYELNGKKRLYFHEVPKKLHCKIKKDRLKVYDPCDYCENPDYCPFCEINR